MAGKGKFIPQPPIDRLGRRTGRVARLVAALAVIAGVALLAWGLLRTHPLAGDERIAEWELVELVTHAGVARAEQAAGGAEPVGERPGGAIKRVEKPPQACPT